MALIQNGNAKLKEAMIPMFNLPAGKQTCGRVCEGCYAVREQERWPSVVLGRERRYQASLDDSFADNVIKEIGRKRTTPKYFRVHSSGDFYSNDYVKSWVKIAKAYPNIIFFAYSKRFRRFDFTELLQLDNFVLINSMQYGKVNYGRLSDAPKGVFVCPDQVGASVRCGIDCTYCMTKKAQQSAPFFVKH